MTGSLHIVRTMIDRVALTTFAARTNTLDDDLGYTLHLALRRRFGGASPQPFRLLDPTETTGSHRDKATGQGPMLLGYVPDPAPLQQTAAPMRASPPDPLGEWGAETVEAQALLRRIFPAPFEAKAMPPVADWRAGQRLAFEVLVRPVRRHSAKVEALRKNSGKGSGGERDAFLNAVETLEKGAHGVTRAAVYSGWLAERFGEAATLERCEMTRFRRSRVVRSVTGKRFKGRGIEGPEALMEGVLAVREPGRFAAVLARGVGRHVAFGYGMLLLRPEVR